MILTGKAKEDFVKWYYSDIDRIIISVPELCYPKNEIIQQALIIEWFDSVGVSIEIGTCPNGFTDDDTPIYYYDWKIYATYNCCESEEEFEIRQEATKQAIIKANQIYNDR